MHGYEMELEDLLTEYHAKQDYGAMMACLLKPALYVLQCIGNGNDSQPASPAATAGAVTLGSSSAEAANGSGTNGASTGGGPGGGHHSTTLTSPSTAKNGHHRDHGGSHHHHHGAHGLNGSSSNGNLESVTSTATATKSDHIDLEGGQNNHHEAGSGGGGLTEAGTGSGLDVIVNHASTLKIDKNKVPVDLRLHGYLSNLAKSCPCPCAVGSRELTIAELSADSLEELHIEAKKQFEDHKLKAFDCNGATRSTLKKIFKGLITPSSSNSNHNHQNNSSSTGKNNSAEASNANAPASGEPEVKSGSKKSGKETAKEASVGASNNDVKNKS